jgi:gliding motility-associated-like protein
MSNGDVFTFDVPVVNISGNLHVDASGSGKIVIPSGVTVNVDGNVDLHPKNSECTASNPCIFEIEVNGTIIISGNLQNDLVTLVWSGSGTVIADDDFKNSSNGCMQCGAGGCPDFQVGSSDCSDDGSGCAGGDFCEFISVCNSDAVDPVISGCPINITVNANASCQAVVNWTAPSFTDNCTGGTLTSTKAPGSTFSKGTTTVIYTATDANGNTATCSFNVTVNDNSAPTITGCPANITVGANASCQAIVNWTAPTLTDNCTGGTLTTNKPPGSSFPIGSTTVSYTATDAVGIKTTCSFNVTVVANDAISFSSCPDDIHIEIMEGNSAVARWETPVVESGCYEAAIISSHNSGDKFAVGTTEVSYQAENSAGKSTECIFNVSVTQNGIFIHEVLTPNGDGQNDLWIIENIDRFTSNEVIIFDRWGSIVFKANGYNNSDVAWSAANVPPGTYYYTLLVDTGNGISENKGFIELVK